MSQENNTEETAFSTVTQALEAAGISDMQLVVAKRDGVTGVLKFDLYTPPNRRSRTEAAESGVSVQKVLL